MIRFRSALLRRPTVLKCALAATLCVGVSSPFAVGAAVQADPQPEEGIEVAEDARAQTEAVDELVAGVAHPGNGKHHHHGHGDGHGASDQQGEGQQSDQQGEGQQSDQQGEGQQSDQQGEGQQSDQQEPVTYLDVDGNEQTVTEYRPFADASSTGVLEGACYLLSTHDLGDMERDLRVTGDVTLIMGGPMLSMRGHSIVVEEGATLRVLPELRYADNTMITSSNAERLVLNRGTLEVRGCTLSGRSLVGVEGTATSSFTMASGKVEGFERRDVLLHGGADAHVRGGKVGTMLLEEGAELHLQGAPAIDAVRLEGGDIGKAPIVCDGQLDLGASVGIDCDGTRTLTKGYGWYTGGAAPVWPDAFFHALGNECRIELIDDTCEVLFCDDRPSYLDENGQRQWYKGDYTDISDRSFEDKKGYELGDGWYVVRSSRKFKNRLNITGDAKLILCDGVTANFKEGIHGVSGKLTIYAQSTGREKGKLIAEGSDEGAGIGGNNNESNGSEVVICGGLIEANGDKFGAGIGGGDCGGCGTIRILGGDVTAVGGRDGGWSFDTSGGAGIGSGADAKEGGYIEIGGGKVYAKGVGYAAGIGSGDEGKPIDVTINNGNIEAYGADAAAGIGGGNETSSGKICITGGTVYAYSTDATAAEGGAAGIGGGDEGNGTVEISGGNVTAKGNTWGAGIGGGEEGKCDVTISGGTVTANGGKWGAGIGSGDEGGTGKVAINGGKVTAKGGKYAAGIGGGNESGCDVEITGGTINATGGEWGAGIGTGDECGSGGKITISGGDVTAKSGDKGAGIGGGNETDGGEITISGGTVNAKGVDGDGAWDWVVGTSGGAGIGGGDEGDSGTIKITGGDVTAEAKGEKARAIGRGDDGKNKTISLGDDLMVVGNKGDKKKGDDRLDAIKGWHWVRVTACE